MTLILKDRVKETTTTVGLGTISLGGSSDTFEPFSTIGTGNTTYYAIVADGNDNWEVGVGTIGAGTLSRDIVLASSNLNAKVNFPAGTKEVFVTLPAGKIVSKDDATGINSGISLADYVDFDTTAAPATSVGRLFWNDQDGTLDLGLKGGSVTIHIGQKQVVRIVNKIGSSLSAANYQCVKISGAQGQRPKVALAQANNDANSADTIGLVNETIANNQEGFVCTGGTITNINTTGSLQGESWNDGDVLYLSGTVAGRITNVRPQAPIHTVIVGFVIYAHANQGKIFVKVDNGYELDELHNVRINGVTNGQVLTYNNGLWENQTNGSGTVTSVSGTGGYGGLTLTGTVTSSGNLTLGGTPTGTWPVSVSGNAATVTNGVYTTGDQTIGGTKTFSNAIAGSITGNASTVTNGVYTTGDQTIAGNKTFSSAIIGSITGNADTVDGYNIQVDGTGTNPNTIYFKTTGGVDPSAAIWGDITGSIVDQTDLYNALVNGTYATGNWNINAESVDGYNIQVDGTGTNPNTIYFKTEGGTISVDWDDVSNTPTTIAGYGITDAVTTSGNQTIGGTKTFSSTITGSITGNADTVDGYNVQVDGTGTNPNTIYFKTEGGTISVDWDDVTNTPTTIAGYGITDAYTETESDARFLGISATAVNSDMVDGYNIQVDGTGTNPNTIYFKTEGGGIGVDWEDISNTPTTVAGYGITDAVTTSGNQTIGGTKTFSSDVILSGGTANGVLYLTGSKYVTSGSTLVFNGSQLGINVSSPSYSLDVAGTFNIASNGSSNTATINHTSGSGIALNISKGGNNEAIYVNKTSGSGNAVTVVGTVQATSFVGALTGNASTVTNGVYTTGDQTIGGTKSFSTSPIYSDTGFQYHQHTSAHVAYIKKTGAYNWYWRRNDTGLTGGANESQLMELFDSGLLNVSGSVYAQSGDMRSPIYYDLNNTAYYLNPADANVSAVMAGSIYLGYLDRNATYTNWIGNNTSNDPVSNVRARIGFTTESGASSSDSYISFHTNQYGVSGGERMRINSVGNVGIGTTSPSNRLHVSSTSAPILAENSGGGSYMVDMKATTGSFNVRLGNGGDAFLLNVNNAERMRVNSSGNVGIGNNNPTFKLDVGGSFRVANDGGGGVGGLWTMRNTASGATNPDKNFRIGATGSLEIINNAYNSIPFTLTDSGTLFAGEAVQAPIYYDVNNTAFYVNPNGTSNISALVMNDLLTGRSSSATDVNGANDTGSFSVRGSSTTVASMSFHRTGAYAINMGLGTDNVFRIGGWSASNNCLQMDGSGNLTMLNNVTAYSDARLKTDIVKIENALDKVQQLNGYTYTRTDTGSRQCGVIAQEVMKVLPEVVMGSEETNYSVAYGNMVGLLIEAMKEQQAQIDELKLTIEQLKGN